MSSPHPPPPLSQNEEDAYRKMRLRVEDVQGRFCLTNFHGMDITTDKLRSLIKKRCNIVENHTRVAHARALSPAPCRLHGCAAPRLGRDTHTTGRLCWHPADVAGNRPAGPPKTRPLSLTAAAALLPPRSCRWAMRRSLDACWQHPADHYRETASGPPDTLSFEPTRPSIDFAGGGRAPL